MSNRIAKWLVLLVVICNGYLFAFKIVEMSPSNGFVLVFVPLLFLCILE